MTLEGMREGVTEQDDAAARSQQRLHPQLQRLHARRMVVEHDTYDPA